MKNIFSSIKQNRNSFFLVAFLSLAFFLPTNQSLASHARGGEIFWLCISPDNRLEINAEYNANFTIADHGKFVFIAKFYGDCTGLVSIFNTFNMPFVVGGYSGGGPNSSPPILVTVTDISPDCFDSDLSWACGPPIVNQSATGPLNGAGAVAEWVFRSNAMQLNGSPPQNGAWVVSIGPHCCRNNATNVSGGPNFFLKSEMYPYPDVPNPRSHGALPPFLSMFPCYDNSPEFLELPNVTACVGDEFTYGPLAFDAELDSLVYDWATLMISATASVNYVSPYTFNNPLPAAAPSVGAVLDPVTGLITFESHLSGTFTTNTEVLAYRCGLPIAAVYRDVQIFVGNCDAAYTGANPPMIPPPNSPPTVTFIPDTTLPMSNPAPNTYRFTAEAGDSVRFTMNAQDFDLLPNSQFQTITFIAASGQLGGANWNDTNACLNPPCAIVTPATGQSGFVSSLNNTIDFFWETDCNHLAANIGCGVFSNEYVFYLKMEDNFCPTPARTLVTVIVDVQAGFATEPELVCVSRTDTGVALTMLPPVDTGFKFNYHTIQADTNNSGNFFTIDTIVDFDPGTLVLPDTFNHPIYFRLVSNVGCDYLSPPSNVVGTLNLSLTSLPIAAVDKDTASLNWNDPRPGSNDTILYTIEMEAPAGSGIWQTLGDTISRSWIEGVMVCSLDVNFRVFYESMSSDSSVTCSNYSNLVGDLFSDVTNNDTIKINYVTVDSDGFAEISFNQSLSGDVIAYYILWFNDSTQQWDIIDTVGGLSNYTWLASQASSRIERFKVISVDSCGNISDDVPVVAHGTILLETDVDVCAGTNTLSWNSYEGWGNSLIGYEVRADINDQGNILPDQQLFVGGPTDTSFVQTDFITGAEYCYRVVAIYAGGTIISESAPKCMNPGVPNPTDLLYISQTEVRGDGVFFRGFIDGDSDASTIIIERSNEPMGHFFELARIEVPETAPFTFTYIDYLADPNNDVYYYRLVAADSCNGVDTVSNVINNIRLDVEAKPSEQNWLTWSALRGYAGELDRYEVYRALGENEPYSLLVDNLGPNDTVFVDDLRDVSKDNATLCYQVRAVERNNPIGLPDGFLPAISRSNFACVTQEAKVVLPNAFRPDSPIEANRTFGAKNRFTDTRDFSFIVLDRWGKVLFETNDPQQEWDGRIGSDIAPTGVYTYFLRYQTEGGLPQEKRGTFTLIR
jgi:gliding motility-associated-like protein